MSFWEFWSPQKFPKAQKSPKKFFLDSSTPLIALGKNDPAILEAFSGLKISARRFSAWKFPRKTFWEKWTFKSGPRGPPEMDPGGGPPFWPAFWPPCDFRMKVGPSCAGRRETSKPPNRLIRPSVFHEISHAIRGRSAA